MTTTPDLTLFPKPLSPALRNDKAARAALQRLALLLGRPVHPIARCAKVADMNHPRFLMFMGRNAAQRPEPDDRGDRGGGLLSTTRGALWTGLASLGTDRVSPHVRIALDTMITSDPKARLWWLCVLVDAWLRKSAKSTDWLWLYRSRRGSGFDRMAFSAGPPEEALDGIPLGQAGYVGAFGLLNELDDDDPLFATIVAELQTLEKIDRQLRGRR